MDSSSDESFSWKKASTGSDTDDDKVNAKKVTPKKHTQHDIKVNSESLNKAEAKKKRKVKNESHDTEEIHGPKKKRIKTELESDSDAVKKKSVLSNITRESVTIEENDLNLQVKQEKGHYFETHNDEKLVKSKKKSKASESIDNDEIESEQNGGMKTEKKSKKNKQVCSQENSINSNIIENEDSILNGKGVHTDTDTEEIRQKSPKKKKSRRKSFTEQNEIDDEHGGCLQKTEILDDSDTGELIQKSLKKKKIKRKEKRQRQIIEFDNFDVEDKFTAEETVVEERSKRVTITEKSDFKTNEVVEYTKERDSEENLEISETHSYSEEYQSPKSKHNDVDSATPKNPSVSFGITQRTLRLSDRIRFEGDTDSEKDIANENASSSLPKKILAQNENLQPVSLQKNTEITDDDEIWIFKCPHDVDINKLNNFNLDGKCKIKISGETYCGVLEDRYPINIVTSLKQEKKIKRKMPNDIIHFKKRLPKPHFPEDNVMINETDFIPLPETKCRHPLFGSNYKDYINIPARSLNSLSEALDSSTSCDRKKKRKHKKECQVETEIQTTIKMDPEVSSIKVPKTEPDSDVPIKKHKKRKHTDHEEYTRKKSKRIKLELNSSDAWESEKAIEENLFNF